LLVSLLLYNTLDNESENANMSFPEEQPKPEEPVISENLPSAQDTFPEEPILPEGFTPLDRNSRLPRARRRRAQRMLVPPGADERAAFMDGLARRATPSFEFFLFAILAGAVLGAAYLLDSPALLLLGILLAPLLTPWVGLTLSILTGSWRFFFLTLGGMLVASLLVFLTGALAGLVGHLWMPLRLLHADIHSHLWWPDLFFVALGAVLLTTSFVHSEQKPIVQSIMLAYGLFLPLSAGGVGLGLGVTPIWPNGVLVFLAHLALAILVGGITLAALRFKPVKASGYLLPFLLGLLSLAALVYFTGLINVIRDGIIATRRSIPTPITLILPSMTPTSTQTETPSPTLTPFTLTSTPTESATPEPTPSYAIISAPQQYGGAVVRSEPAVGPGIAVLDNGSLVQVLPVNEDVNGVIWVRIRMENNVEGWVLQDVLSATSLTLSPASTLTPTPTP
jgi:MFS family permease